MARDIENACISDCQFSADLCASCARSKEDIRKWRRMKRPEKIAAVQRAILRLCERACSRSRRLGLPESPR
ncbi:DUF1289 domain-containing protein [Pseudomonas akapageensis]|uniref:DUF1289 domain-containing protein n=1 Tax=Pseudomonas akapageensis TaxID=2609961 RepID=UPI0014089D1B|nr:DUF1289 domain-containing protein [Pseudomonas akapageensis]